MRLQRLFEIDYDIEENVSRYIDQQEKGLKLNKK
jgi:hypothetical protein